MSPSVSRAGTPEAGHSDRPENTQHLQDVSASSDPLSSAVREDPVLGPLARPRRSSEEARETTTAERRGHAAATARQPVQTEAITIPERGTLEEDNVISFFDEFLNPDINPSPASRQITADVNGIATPSECRLLIAELGRRHGNHEVSLEAYTYIGASLQQRLSQLEGPQGADTGTIDDPLERDQTRERALATIREEIANGVSPDHAADLAIARHWPLKERDVLVIRLYATNLGRRRSER